MFELLPILDKIIELYQIPIGQKRFEAYLKLLEGETKGNLSLPIGAFNPMAKEHVLMQLNSLKKMGAEEAIQNELKKLNSTLPNQGSHSQFKVALNLADDLKGGWTNKFTTDYDIRFKLNPYLKRGFCVSIIWTSEQHSIDLIVKRTLQGVYRTIYRLSQSQPKTLLEHVAQEDFVLIAINQQVKHNQNFLELHKNSENYHVIFNYFYGDQASEMMAFPVYGSTGLNLN
jgi:hypothetical protein